MPDEFKKKPAINMQFERELAHIREGFSSSCPPKAQIKVFDDEVAMTKRKFTEENDVVPVSPAPKAAAIPLLEALQDSGEMPKVESEETARRNNEEMLKVKIEESPRGEMPRGNNEEMAGSRFYIKKGIIVGNISKMIQPGESTSATPFTHKWKIYIRGPEIDPNIETFVQKVRFYLHPSYKPNDIIEVAVPPFNLSRRGWGEFPVRIQLFFWDPLNKPIDIIHMLKLNHMRTGGYKLGKEIRVDIDLDRNTKFVTKDERFEQDFDILKALNEENDKDDQIVQYSESIEKYIDKNASAEPPKEDDMLEDAVKYFPMIKSTKVDITSPIELTYIPAPSYSAFLSYHVSRKKELELARAKHMAEYIKAKRAISIPVKKITEWCIEKGFTPSFDDPSLPTKNCYCRFCGKIFVSSSKGEQEASYEEHLRSCDSRITHGQLCTLSNTKAIELQLKNFKTEEDVDMDLVDLDFIEGVEADVGDETPLMKFVGDSASLLNISCSHQSRLLMSVAMKKFIESLIDASCENVEKEALTPLHVFKAIKNASKQTPFDFLSNKYLRK